MANGGTTLDETHRISGLYANVLRPAGVTEKSKLPVVVVSTYITLIDRLMFSELLQWIYGGGFAVGDGSSYDGTTVVQRSVQLGEPVIYVNFNYRLNAFGFLAGKEALAGGAANIGIYDRKHNLPLAANGFIGPSETNNNDPGFLQRGSSLSGYKRTFPSSAVIRTRSLCEFIQFRELNVPLPLVAHLARRCSWGQSAGGISITAHMVTNPVNPPFKAAIPVRTCKSRNTF